MFQMGDFDKMMGDGIAIGGDMRVGPLGTLELVIILLIILLIFGARRLPEIGTSLGRGIRTFKSAITGEDEKQEEEEEEKQQASSKPGDDLP